MTYESDESIREGRVVQRGPLQDAALILLSPIWLLGFLVGIPLLTIVGWVAGGIMLWLSRAWRKGEKLIGTLLSGVSLIYGGVGVSVRTEDPDRVWAALALLVFLLLLQMVPATIGVIYLWRKLRARSAPVASEEQAGEHLVP